LGAGMVHAAGWLCDAVGAGHLPIGAVSYSPLDSYGPFQSYLLCVDESFGNITLYILRVIWFLCVVHCLVFRKEQVWGTVSVPIFSWKDGEAPTKMGPT
jgi:hypothetical protein